MKLTELQKANRSATYWKNETISLRADMLCIRRRLVGLAKKERNGYLVHWMRNILDIVRNIEVPISSSMKVKYNGS